MTRGELVTTIRVTGIPAPQGSKRHVGRGVMVEQSKYLPAWRKNIITAAKMQYRGNPLDQPVQVRAVVYMPKPKRPKFPVPAVAPDTDKLARAIGDALQYAGVVKDDARIITWHITKQYAEGRPPGAVIHIITEQGQEPIL